MLPKASVGSVTIGPGDVAVGILLVSTMVAPADVGIPLSRTI